MAHETVIRTRKIAAMPAAIWAHVRDFCAPWHPLIATMSPQGGGQVRAFTMHGESTVFRERLTWFSDTQMTYRYIHIQGIADVEQYAGSLSVQPSASGGCLVTMAADISAQEPRAKEIAQGTAEIFDLGLDALTLVNENAQSEDAYQNECGWSTQTIGKQPSLTFDVTPKLDGPLCLFLHGIGGNRSNWKAQLGMAGQISQSAALDLRGYGDSTLGSEQSTLDDYCNDILQVADALDAEKLVLCGLSYGAWIATAFAEKYPDRLLGLILSGGCTGMSQADETERDAFRVSREVPLDAGQTPADFAPAVINAIIGPNVSQDALAAMQCSMAAIKTDTYRDALRCFTNPPGQFDFSRVTMPVLMMTGEHDKLAPPAEIESVAKRIYQNTTQPDVRFEVIKGAGHICNIEAPALYNAPLMEFLKRVAR